MSYYIALVFVGVILGVALVFAIRSRSPLRASAALVGIFLVLAGPLFPIPGPQATPSTAATVQDFGDAAFKKFYDHYAALLGAPVASAGQQGGVLSQWFRYARVDFVDTGPGSGHPDFPKFTLAPVGTQQMKVDHVPASANPKLPGVIARYLESKARDDFYSGFVPLQPSSSGTPQVLVQDFGDARFKDFYDVYARVLGEPISAAGTYKGFPSQWFRYGRVEFHNEYEGALNLQFPKLQLGLVGREVLEKRGLSPYDRPGVAPILEAWLSESAKTQDILYLYGNPLTNPKPDETTGYTTQYFERAVFQWPNGSTNPRDVSRLSVGQELFSDVQSSGGPANVEQARAAFREYFFGGQLTGEILDKATKTSTVYFARAVFQWPTGSEDPTEVRQLALGSLLYTSLNQPPAASPWSSPIRVLLLTLGGVVMLFSLVLAVLLRDSAEVYGGRV